MTLNDILVALLALATVYAAFALALDHTRAARKDRP